MARKKTRNALTYPTLPALFTGICDAIRTKTGTVGTINHQDIPTAIGNISTGSTVDVIYEYAKNNEPAHAANYNFINETMPDAGKCKVHIATGFINFSGNEGVLKKNGTTVSKTIDSYSSGYGFLYYEFDVVKDDVITFSKPSSTNANTAVTIVVVLDKSS